TDAIAMWRDGSDDRRRVLASMTYPLGNDALARAELLVSTSNDFEQTEMAPQTDILLQVLADVLALNLSRVGSALAPRKVSEIVGDPAPARRSSPELAVRTP